MAATHLHTYQCHACKGTLATPAKGFSRCLYCRTPMRYLWSEPITTDAHRAIAAKGGLYNAGVQPAARPTCPGCGHVLGGLYNVTVGGQRFCKAACAAAHLTSQPAPVAGGGTAA